MIVSIKQHHIDKGEHGSSCFCPFALAVAEQLDLDSSDKLVVVDYVFVDVGDKSYLHSRSSSYWVRSYDEGKPMKPADFQLRRT